MGNTFGENPPEIQKINQDEFDTPEAQASFRKQMHENGFVVITLNDTTLANTKCYLDVTKEFFLQTQEKKDSFSATEEMKKKNEGYLVVDGIKEFLKIKPTDEAKQKFPDLPTFKPAYVDCQASLYPLCEIGLKHLATDILESGKPYMDPAFHTEVQRRMKERSSLTVINYFGRSTPQQRGETVKSDGDDGLFVPSAVHTDTGILTLISCSDVPGLQVQPHGREEFLEVEKMFSPRRDMFMVLGQKTEIFCQEAGKKDYVARYQPTVHRVHLPYNTPRSSILLFADVPV